MTSQLQWKSIIKHSGYSAFVEFQYHRESGGHVLVKHISSKAEDTEYLAYRAGISILLQRVDLLREQILKVGMEPEW